MKQKNRKYINRIEKDIVLPTIFGEQSKSEAIKEFAERLKSQAYSYSDICGYRSTVVDVAEIDGVLKEMTGEQK